MARGWLLQVSIVVLLAVTSCSYVLARDCQAEDFIGEYTTCVNGRKNLIYYKDPIADCTGTTNQPANVFGILCEITCPSGQYLPIGSTSSAACTPCSAGSYSLGGGTRIEGSGWVNNARGWAAVSNSQINFRTSCINVRTGQPAQTNACTKWLIVEGSLAYSGNTTDNYQSVLEASATFVREGNITFEYRVDAERGFDFFDFEMDDVTLITRVSQQLNYLRVSFVVPAGVHVFRWKYTKDFSLAYGEDAVVLRMLEVTGTAFADSECTRCSPGFSAQGMGNKQCTPCPANTAAPFSGSATCPACGLNEYSFVGATRCSASAPCVAADVMSYYSSCHANNTRSRYYYYQTPKICSEHLPNAYRKPNDQYDLECAQCSPGWYRNSNTHTCEGCPTNTFSPGGGVPCQPCASGKVGRRDFIWTNFEELPNPAIPAAMGCTGDCGTQGWRLGSGFIDSGIGHGAYPDVFFTLNLTVVSVSTVNFNISFSCNRLCSLSYTDHDITGGNASRPILVNTHSAYSFIFTRDRVYPQTVAIRPGEHMLTFHFSKFDGSTESLNDMVKIHGVHVMSVAASQGGAASCQSCVAGQYADSNTPYCKLTPPGTYTENLAARPSPCPANTYAEFEGSTTCYPCGQGTSSPQGSAWCDESCTYRLNSEVNYDLKPLSRPGGDMYGPVVDSASRRNYYLNVCSRDHTNQTCFDEDNYALSTQACLTDAWGYGLDIGRVTNFYPHPTNPEMGLTLVYRNSTADTQYPCRLTVNGVRTVVPRSTNITFNCDPMAGFGAPEFRQEGSNVCTFNFVWNSLFACSACDESDWNYYYTECSGGVQYKTFKWKDNPRRCHGGLPLPAPISRPCSLDNQRACPAGTYLLEDCTPCEDGTYSLGGGRILNWWPYRAVPDSAVFTATDLGFVTQQGAFLEFRVPVSGNTRTASLTATFNWVTSGSISMAIAAVTGNGYTINLRTDTMDIDASMPITTRTIPQNLVFDMSPGTHTFQFTISKLDGVQTDHEGWLRIYNITTMGTSRAASQCTQALPGTIAPYKDRLPQDCPINTIQPRAGQTTCEPVEPTRWSPVGSERSYQTLSCGFPDYEIVSAGACVLDGKQDVELRLRPNVRCTAPFRTIYRIPCGCAPGMYLDTNAVCRACAIGTGWDPSTRSCVRPSRGHAAIGVYSFVKGRLSLPGASRDISSTQDVRQNGDNNMDLLKRGAEATWYTSCSGTCVRPWTLGITDVDGPVLDSGVQVGWSSSSITIVVPLSDPGTLSVSYRRQGGANTQFQILVDGVVAHTNKDAMTTQVVNVPLAAGERQITLVVFANEEVIANAVVRVTDLQVTGAMIGGALLTKCPAGTFSGDGATSCTPCGPGYFSENPGSASCQMCPDDQYMPFFGSTRCLSCPAGTKTSADLGHSVCTPSCEFTRGDYSYNWRDLPLATATVPAEKRRLGWPDIAVDVCRPLLDGCVGPDGRKNAAFACGTQTSAFPGDAQFNFATQFNGATYDSGTQQIGLNYILGDNCSSGQRRTLQVTLQCPGHSSASQAAPQLVQYSQCHAEMAWYTTSACRACTMDDYQEVLGQCSKRLQTVNYVLASTDCHHNEFTQPPPTTKHCSQVGVSVGLLVGIGIALLLLAASLVIFCMRHRKLSTEYRLLKAAHDGTFEDHETQFGVDDEEGVTLDQIHAEEEDDDDGLRLPTAQTSDD
jgi:hypothetical protein